MTDLYSLLEREREKTLKLLSYEVTAFYNYRNTTPEKPILARGLKDISCSDIRPPTPEIHTLERSYLSFSETICCNYKGHSDHTLRAIFHMRHNWFISGVRHTNYERCTGACRATSNFPSSQVEVKGTYAIIGDRSAQQRHTEKGREEIEKETSERGLKVNLSLQRWSC